METSRVDLYLRPAGVSDDRKLQFAFRRSVSELNVDHLEQRDGFAAAMNPGCIFLTFQQTSNV